MLYSTNFVEDNIIHNIDIVDNIFAQKYSFLQIKVFSLLS